MDNEERREEQQEQPLKERARQYLYYIIIAVISFISVVFLPMVGSTIGLGWNLPNTTTGWVVWAVSRAIVATINVLIFYSFMEQAKLNVRDDEHYKAANEILIKAKKKEHEPLSPAKWQARQYGKKGTTIFLSSAMSVVALGQAILTFDWVSMLSYLFTLAMGLIFGIMQMKKAEAYWTREYYEYALKKQKESEELEKEKEQDDCDRQQGIAQSAGTSREEQG